MKGRVNVKSHKRKTRLGKTTSVKTHTRSIKKHKVPHTNKITDKDLKERLEVVHKSFDKWVEKNGGIDRLLEEDHNSLESYIHHHTKHDYLDQFRMDEKQRKKVEDTAKQTFYNDTKERYDDIIFKFSSMDSPIVLYRMITSDEPDFDNIGVYWTDNEHKPNAYLGVKGRKIILEAEVNPQDIKWKESMELNMQYGVGEEEQEIRLYPNRDIFITKVISARSKKKLQTSIKAKT